MGRIAKLLVERILPPRPKRHHSFFADVAENIHIHHRELRFVLSKAEFDDFVSRISQAGREIGQFIRSKSWKPDTDHDTMFKTHQGSARISPESDYFPYRFCIERLDSSMRDEIHIHFREYRFGMSEEQFVLIAEAFREALYELRGDSLPLKAESLPCARVRSRYGDPESGWGRTAQSESWIKDLQRQISEGSVMAPIIVSRPSSDGIHTVIDGEHRYLAYKREKSPVIPCVVMDCTFEESREFRRAEACLKRFDHATGGRFDTAGFNRKYILGKLSDASS
jgi:hypothetical protein